MNKTLKVLLIAEFILAASLFNPQIGRAFAQAVCQPIFGGGQTCVTDKDITVQTKILNPDTNQMVDNLSINDAKYRPGFNIIFQISITNHRTVVIRRANMKDIFPQYVNFSSGPGSFNVNTRTLLFDIDNLQPSETRTVNIQGKIADVSQLSFSENVLCVVNQVVGTVIDPAIGQDNAQFCIERTAPIITSANTKVGFPVLNPSVVSKTPATGPEMFSLIAMLPTGIAGLFLRKQASPTGRKKGGKIIWEKK